MAGKGRRRGPGASDGDAQPKPRQWPLLGLGRGEWPRLDLHSQPDSREANSLLKTGVPGSWIQARTKSPPRGVRRGLAKDKRLLPGTRFLTLSASDYSPRGFRVSHPGGLSARYFQPTGGTDRDHFQREPMSAQTVSMLIRELEAVARQFPQARPKDHSPELLAAERLTLEFR